jgi:beta-lactam-binding protein with PASTA domain
VIRQNPPGGSTAADGSTVLIVVSAFEEPTESPTETETSTESPNPTDTPTIGDPP